jgi:hypothetical protein
LEGLARIWERIQRHDILRTVRESFAELLGVSGSGLLVLDQVIHHGAEGGVVGR